jgi:hypothetical protein
MKGGFMQEDLNTLRFSKEDEHEITPKDFYVWANSHVRLCEVYNFIQKDNSALSELSTQLQESLLQGKLLLKSLSNQICIHNSKPLIPASGLNRFNHSSELINSGISKNYPFKAELGTSTNLRAVPMPSRTYLKKKNQTQ